MGGSQPTLPLHDEDHHYDDDDDNDHLCDEDHRYDDQEEEDDDDEEGDDAQSGLVQILGHTGDTEAPGVWQEMRSRFIQPSNVIFLRI